MFVAFVLLLCVPLVFGQCVVQPCLNGGTCYDVLYQPDIPTVCICPECYGGDRCENRIWCSSDVWSSQKIGGFSTEGPIMVGAVSADVFSLLLSLFIMAFLIAVAVLSVWLGLKFEHHFQPKLPSGKYPQQELKKRNAPEPSPSEQTTQPSSVADDQGLTSESTQKSDTY